MRLEKGIATTSILAEMPSRLRNSTRMSGNAPAAKPVLESM
jgi:hypothetical protein